ncbi:hypothetical protein K8R62_02925 [bacterium]|nr:hypothetical protein [bacterium]
MILYLDTVTNIKKIKIALLEGGKSSYQGEFSAYKKQSEKLLFLIDKVLNDNDLKLSDIEKIKVNNKGGSFTSLRIGVVTANSLAFALNIPIEGEYKEDKPLKINKINVVEPKYDLEPNITIKKKNIY